MNEKNKDETGEVRRREPDLGEQKETPEGHRKRMRDRFFKNGLEYMEDYEVLELILCCSIPRIDVRPLAKRLLERFGSLAAVFDAPADMLQKVPGIGVSSAFMIKLIPQIGRRYLMSRVMDNIIINTVFDAGVYLMPRFHGLTVERAYLLCLDAKGKVIGCEMLTDGEPNEVIISVRRAVSTALKYGASRVIIAHNHTSGMALPSTDDVTATFELIKALEMVNIDVLDHIVFADDDFVSMASNGMMKGGVVMDRYNFNISDGNISGNTPENDS